MRYAARHRTRMERSMTRDSRAWRWIGFLIALVGVGFPYWQLATEQAGLPRALYGPGLVAVGVIAMLPSASSWHCCTALSGRTHSGMPQRVAGAWVPSRA